MKVSEQGRSMIEMLGVLAIVGVLSLGGLAGYSKSMQKYNDNILIEQLSLLTMNIRAEYMSQKDFSTISAENIIKAGMAPSSMYDSNAPTRLVNKYKGDIYVLPSDYNGELNKAFEIYVAGLPNKTCVTLSSMDWGQNIASGFVGLYIGPNDDRVGTAIMKDVLSPADSDPEHGIYTPGRHDYSIPLPPTIGLTSCQCDDNCVIGLKYY